MERIALMSMNASLAMSVTKKQHAQIELVPTPANVKKVLVVMVKYARTLMSVQLASTIATLRRPV
jgi:hypothetical protein